MGEKEREDYIGYLLNASQIFKNKVTSLGVALLHGYCPHVPLKSASLFAHLYQS